MKACQLLFCVLLTAFCPSHFFGQRLSAHSNILNFSKDVYNAGTQTWDIAQDCDNIIYFANNEGLLKFDGTYWQLYPLPGGSIVRSICIGEGNRVYAGGQDDFGYYAPDAHGSLVFTSLKALLRGSDAFFSNIWDIVSFDGAIFFRGRDRIFRYKHKKIDVFKNDDGWLFLGLHQNRPIAQDGKNRLLAFNGDKWETLLDENESLLPKSFLIKAVTRFGKDSSLVTTQKGNLYMLSGRKITAFELKGNPFPNHLFLSASPVSNDLTVIGTNVGGCFIIDKSGNVVQTVSRSDGLQNNTVVSIFADTQHNLWLGLDNGIDFISTNHAVNQIYPDRVNEGVGYSSVVYNDELYIGTSYGLFKTAFDAAHSRGNIKPEFTFVPPATGPVWSLTELEGNLLMANHEGAFVLNNGHAHAISTGTGYWNFLPLKKNNGSLLVLAGSYKGIELLELKNDSFSSLGTLKGIMAAPRSMQMDTSGNIWVGTLFTGVYRLRINDAYQPAYRHYTEKSGLPSPRRNRVLKIRNRILVATDKGLYEYNAKQDRFQPSAFLAAFFRGKDIRLLNEDKEGNIWFIEGKSVGVIDQTGGKDRPLYFPELEGRMVSGNSLEFIYPYNCNNVFVGSEKGFYHLNLEDYKKNNYTTKVKVTSVEAVGYTDSLLFGGYHAHEQPVGAHPKGAIPAISHTWNTLHFRYSSPSYGYQANVQYRIMLEGYDREWSAWMKNTRKEYTNLPPGTFTFTVNARTNLSDKVTSDSYTFTILPPWYSTWWAYIAYALLLGALVYTLYKEQKKQLLKQQKKHEEEQERLQYLFKLELENSEKQIIALRNEKLKAELEGKNSELASAAMHVVHKGEILSKIKDELVRLKKASDADGSSDHFKKLIKALNEEDKLDEEWNQFASHFDNVHSDFLKALRDAYPNLTHSEIKLCTYLQMNLSSKEIAQVLNISVRGVEISRYRLRKKLRISTETNLYDFFMEFSSTRSKQGIVNEGRNTEAG